MFCPKRTQSHLSLLIGAGIFEETLLLGLDAVAGLVGVFVGPVKVHFLLLPDDRDRFCDGLGLGSGQSAGQQCHCQDLRNTKFLAENKVFSFKLWLCNCLQVLNFITSIHYRLGFIHFISRYLANFVLCMMHGIAEKN